MKGAGRAFAESCVLHGVLAAALLCLGGVITSPPETIRLDFSLQEQVAAVEAPLEQAVAADIPAVRQAPLARKSVSQPRPQLKVRAKAPPPTRPAPPNQDPPATAAAEPEPAAAPAPATAEPAAAAAGQGRDGAPAGAGNRVASTDEAYRRAHFVAIRDAILAHLQYPLIARRRGWSGQVEVCFLIAPDGSVSELRIRSSSGHAVLDEQALAAIRRAAPFTPPRVAALLVMPITFQLN